MHGLTVVFDLDGTLVETAPDLINATNHVMALAGLPPVEPGLVRRCRQTLEHQEAQGAQHRVAIVGILAVEPHALAQARLVGLLPRLGARRRRLHARGVAMSPTTQPLGCGAAGDLRQCRIVTRPGEVGDLHARSRNVRLAKRSDLVRRAHSD